MKNLTIGTIVTMNAKNVIAMCPNYDYSEICEINLLNVVGQEVMELVTESFFQEMQDAGFTGDMGTMSSMLDDVIRSMRPTPAITPVTPINTLFKDAHKIAKAIVSHDPEGNLSYRDWFKYAIELIQGDKLDQVNTLLDVSSIASNTILNKVVAPKAPKAKKPVAPKAPKTPKAPKSDTAPKAPKAPKTVEKPQPTKLFFHGIPSNIQVIFPDQYETIVSLVKGFVEYTNKKGGTFEPHVYDAGIKALGSITPEFFETVIDGKKKKVAPHNRLQATMLTHFLHRQAKSIIQKFIMFGENYEISDVDTFSENEFGETEILKMDDKFNYENGLSSDGSIHQFSIDDIFNQLVSNSMTQTFSKTYFNNPKFFHSLFTLASTL